MANVVRTRKTIEPPRPLKTSQKSVLNPLQDNQVTDEYLISFAETLANTLLTNSADLNLHSELIWLSHQLKLRGPILEVNYGDSLDKIFVMFRNALQYDEINYNIRLPLLQLIELRANRWKTSDGANSYYRPKVSKLQEVKPMEQVVLSPSPEPFSNIAPGQMLLEQGEVVRNSGKYSRPTKIQGKNYSKDEVVIRNADSGKVMGIKGRRVHMIEELSETIISFQRVNPGAKERLVQITGPTESKINYAKELIEDTIRRNASPVRSVEHGALKGGADCELENEDVTSYLLNQDEIGFENNQQNYSSLEEYKYSVIIGNEVIKITGTCLNYVIAAKLELDKFFSTKYFQRNAQSDSNEVFKEESPTEDDVIAGFGNGFSSVPITEEVQTKPIERRKYFHRKSSEFKDFPESNINGNYKYSHETLLNISKSSLSLSIPKDYDVIIKNNINRVKQVKNLQDLEAANTVFDHSAFLENNNYLHVQCNNNQHTNTNNNGQGLTWRGSNNFFCVHHQYNKYN